MKNTKIKFSTFIKESFDDLNEALDSPVEFYMTDDTKMPDEIYAAYQSNGNDYGMSLVRSQWTGVYILDFYLITNKKRRKWAFKTSQDVRIGLSSVIKFVEACQPFLGNKMKGIVIGLPTAKESQRYVSFLRRAMKKSHIKSYREVPVKKLTDKARNYLFLIKKNMEPQQLFKNNLFTKHFEFDPLKDEVSMDSDGMDIASEKLKKEKVSVSTQPDPVLAFGKLNVTVTTGEELVNALDDAVSKFNSQNDENVPSSAQSTKVSKTGYKIEDEAGMTNVPLSVVFSYMMPDARINIINHGFDPEKINKNNMNYVLSSKWPELSYEMKKTLMNSSIFNPDGSLNWDGNEEDITKSLALMGDVSLKSINQFINLNNKMEKEAGTSSVGDGKIELDFALGSNVPGFEDSGDASFQSGDLGFEQNGEKLSLKISSMYKMKSVQKWRMEVENGDNLKGYQKLVRYTGNYAGTWNNKLRSAVSSKKINFSELGDGVTILSKYFVSSAPALDESIWVYRNADFPMHFNVGEDIIDAAFLSTTIHSKMGFGDSGNARMKIFVPKGTKCFPILNDSEHAGEAEIVLPPMSVLKVIEKNTKSSGKTYYTCVMIGSAVESLVESGSEEIILEGVSNDEIDNLSEEEKKMLLDEAKRKIRNTRNSKNKEDGSEEEYDPSGKWGSSTSREDSEALKKLIKSGKLKVK
ncbi:hypothetical protein WCWAEYFT_CDS0139 [Vibrio phage VB_VaC_TDDLMA]